MSDNLHNSFILRPQNPSNTPESPALGAVTGPPQKRHRGGTKGAKKPPKQLRDMRWVYDRKDLTDVQMTPGQAKCNELFKRDPDAFLKLLQTLETRFMASKVKPVHVLRAEAQARAESADSKKADPDPRTKTIVETIDELLARLA